MTNVTPCNEIVDRVRSAFAAGFVASERGGICFVTTPLLRHDNDAITVRVESGENGPIVVTDGGQSIDYLRHSGFSTRANSSFRRFLQTVEHSFGVRVVDGEILLEATEQDLPVAIEQVARAALHVSYLVFRRRERVVATFDEKVEVDLIKIGAQYDTDVTIEGQTRLARFRFLVDSGRNAIVHPLSATSRAAADAKAERFMFHVLDVQKRTDAYRFFPVIDDQGAGDEHWSRDVITALVAYSDGLVRWSHGHTVRLQEVLDLPEGAPR